MSKQLGLADRFGLGFMILAFFLGAGNWIFPPMAGQMAGTEVLPATLGFLVTAVGLPLLGILSLAAAQGGFSRLGRFLPPVVSITLAMAIYLIMVPGFGVPRTALVAYEMGIKPFFGDTHPQLMLALFSVIYFCCSCLLALNTSRLLDTVGKVITPIMLVLLLIVGGLVFFAPIAPVGTGQGEFVDTPFTKGFVEGYLTMDLLAAMLFGVLLINTLSNKGVVSKQHQFNALFTGGAIAAAGLTLVYVILFYLGATSHAVASGADNGGEIFSQYMAASLGTTGQVVLGLVVGLACLTTAVGGTSAFASYLRDRWPALGYRRALLIITFACIVVANVGLSQLLSWFIPVLFAVYPVAIVVVVLNLASSRLPSPKRSFQLVFPVALVFGLLDALKVAGFSDALPLAGLLQSLPFYDLGLGWVVPVVASFMVSLSGPAQPEPLTEQGNA